MKYRSIAVIGADGNIGRVLVPYLEAAGHTTRLFDVTDGCGFRGCSFLDVTDRVGLFRALRDPDAHFDAVINLAALPSRVLCEQDTVKALWINTTGAHNVAEVCDRLGLRLLHVSTSEVALPVNWYGWTKLWGEQAVLYAVRERKLNAVVVRPFMFYHEEETIAPYRSFMIRLVSDLLLDRPVEVHAGTDRAWCHMDDGVEMMQRVLESGLYDISVDIGVSETISTEQLAAMVCRRLGKSLDLLRRVSLPERMHASKEADLNVIRRLGCAQQVALTAGLDRVIRRVKERLGIENHGA